MPLRRDQYLVSMVSLISNGISLLLCVADHALHVRWINKVVDIEGVGTIRNSPFRVPVGEVLKHLHVLLDLRVDVLDAELVELGHVDRPELGHREQALLVGKDLLEEVLVDHRVRGQVELHCNGVRQGERLPYGTG